jgi:hypothetical protein
MTTLLLTLACSYSFIELSDPAGIEVQEIEEEHTRQDSSQAGFGTIRGFVKDLETCEGIPGVIVMFEDTLIGTASNFSGKFLIKNIPPGSYTLVAKTIGYDQIIVEDLIIEADEIIELDIVMQSCPTERGGCPMWHPVYQVFIDRYQTSNQKTLYEYGIETMPVSTANDILKKTQRFVR